MSTLALVAYSTGACTKTAPTAPTDEAQAAESEPANASEPKSDTTRPARVEQPQENLLDNPGFEEGRTGWSWKDKSKYWVDFAVQDTTARTGSRALELELDSDEGTKLDTRVAAVVQEFTTPEFPSRLGGYYYVEEFEKSDPRISLYLQVVVIILGEEKDNLPNYQMRYYLAGQPQLASAIGNAKVEIIDGEQPDQNTWVAFDLPIREDFERLWGSVPSGYDRFDVFYELRWDNLPPDGSVKAKVLYDDLFLAP